MTWQPRAIVLLRCSAETFHSVHVDSAQRVAAQARDAGWEFMAHGYDQIPMHKLEDQRGTIRRAMDVIEKFTGKRSVGWLGPGLTQTLDTPDLLAEAGVRYIGDWVYDDEPTEIATTHGPLVTLPYTLECNDIAMMATSLTARIATPLELVRSGSRPPRAELRAS